MNGQWLYRTMFDEIPLPLDWPVYVSQAEASAYARWAGKSLPTEAEWHRAAYGVPAGSERPYPWGREAPHPALGNFDFSRWDPVPVNAFPSGASAFGVQGMLGNGWEWTSTVFAPFRDSSLSPSTVDTPPTFSTASTSLCKAAPRTLPRACCGRRFATGFRAIISTCMRGSAACKL